MIACLFDRQILAPSKFARLPMKEMVPCGGRIRGKFSYFNKLLQEQK